jgi:serine/threonine-protein kinase HipA
MNTNYESIKVHLFDQEVGTIGFNLDTAKTVFQYNADFLKNNSNAFPFILKKTELTQSFSNVNNTTFKNLPSVFADSLPDSFGNIILNRWLESRKTNNKLTPIQQLAYMSNRGMGALEYKPGNTIPSIGDFGLSTVVSILNKVLDQKASLRELKLNEAALYTILRIGSSAGGARPKIIVSEHKETGNLIAGDRSISDEYNHYLVKLYMNDPTEQFNSCALEYGYYLMALDSGLKMMPSKLIEGKHFATERYDRINGEKIHTLTVSGLTGWDFKSTDHSSYENLFKLSIALKVPHSNLEETFRKMVFNVVNNNIDDHLKNHSFQFDLKSNKWSNTPFYDLTYATNPFMKYTRIQRALSINGKRNNIKIDDILKLAKTFSIRNPKEIIKQVNTVSLNWSEYGKKAGLDELVINAVQKDIEPIKMNLKKSRGRKM